MSCYIYVEAGAGGDNTKSQADSIKRSVMKSCSKKSFTFEYEGDEIHVLGDDSYR